MGVPNISAEHRFWRFNKGSDRWVAATRQLCPFAAAQLAAVSCAGSERSWSARNCPSATWTTWGVAKLGYARMRPTVRSTRGELWQWNDPRRSKGHTSHFGSPSRHRESPKEQVKQETETAQRLLPVAVIIWDTVNSNAFRLTQSCLRLVGPRSFQVTSYLTLSASNEERLERV